MSTDQQCPCGSGQSYDDCCGRYHSNKALPETAEQLMRSRYCAFVLKLDQYLINTRHPGKRQQDTIAQLQHTFANTIWLGLEILSKEKGTRADKDGFVSFAASYKDNNGEDVLYERSCFHKEGDQWYYVEGNFDLGRNDPCWCGSGKKFKKCHGR